MNFNDFWGTILISPPVITHKMRDRERAQYIVSLVLIG